MAYTNKEKQARWRQRHKERIRVLEAEVNRLRNSNSAEELRNSDAEQTKASFLSALRPLLDGLHAEGKKTEATTSPKTVAYLTAKLEEMLVGWDLATYGKPKRCCLCGDPIIHGVRVVIPDKRNGFAHWKCQNAPESIVQEEVRKRLDEISLPHYFEQIEKLSKMLRWPRNSVMTKSEYNTILMCIHPDRINGLTHEQMAEAFRIFTYYRHKLVLDEDAINATMSTLPRTKEEMMARKSSRKSASKNG